MKLSDVECTMHVLATKEGKMISQAFPKRETAVNFLALCNVPEDRIVVAEVSVKYTPVGRAALKEE